MFSAAFSRVAATVRAVSAAFLGASGASGGFPPLSGRNWRGSRRWCAAVEGAGAQRSRAAALLLVVVTAGVAVAAGVGAIPDPHFSASVKTCCPELFPLVKERSGNYVKQTKNFSAALAAVSLRNREFFVERPT